MINFEVESDDSVVEVVESVFHDDFTAVTVKFSLDMDDDRFSIIEPIVAEGISKRDPVDRANEQLALTLAYGRALDKIAKKLLKRAEGMIKHEDDVRAYRAVQKDRARKAAQAQARKAKRAAKN